MAFVDMLTPDETAGRSAELMEEDRARVGYVPNYSRVLSRRPDTYAAWGGLIGAVRAKMDPRRYELVTVAAARRLRSSYCSLEHGRILASQFLGAAVVRDVVADHRSAGLDEVDVAVMDVADKVAADATSVTAEDVDRLRSLGLTELEILDVVFAAAARCFFSKTLDALGVEPDNVYYELELDLREALTVGRPIATT